MNTLEDTISTLEPMTQELVHGVIQSCEEQFSQDTGVPAAIFAIKAGEEKVRFQVLEEFNDEVRESVHRTLAGLRDQCPVVGFLSECWMKCYHTKHKVKTMEEAEDWATTQTRPSESPDRIEVVMFNVWQGDRTLLFQANIHRNPDRLGEWGVFHDYYFPKHGIAEVGGGVIGKNRYKQKNN
jgi:hypothetical protein